MQGGQFVPNGIAGDEMVIIFQAKEKRGGKLIFLPMNIQVQQAPGVPSKQVYSNVMIHRPDPAGVKAGCSP
jgi:hypothetical protein